MARYVTAVLASGRSVPCKNIWVKNNPIWVEKGPTCHLIGLYCEKWPRKSGRIEPSRGLVSFRPKLGYFSSKCFWECNTPLGPEARLFLHHMLIPNHCWSLSLIKNGCKNCAKGTLHAQNNLVKNKQFGKKKKKRREDRPSPWVNLS